MAGGFKTEDVQLSQEIFYYLLVHHELKEKADPKLFRAYSENRQVQELVKSQGSAAQAQIERYGKSIYLIPDTDNTFLGFSKSELKLRLCRSNAGNVDFYLSQFVIMVLLVTFYDGQGASSKTREYIPAGILQNRVSDYLKEGAEHASEDSGIVFREMLDTYESLGSDPESKRPAKNTKEGLLKQVLLLLQDQGLIDYMVEDDIIQPTQKLDDMMDWNVLNMENYGRVREVFGGLRNEQD